MTTRPLTMTSLDLGTTPVRQEPVRTRASQLRGGLLEAPRVEAGWAGA